MKKCRGYFKHACDNAAVTIASNCHTHFPVKTVKRYSKAEKKHVDITEPNIIRQYNKYMGGVDVMDKIKEMVVEFIFTCVEYGRSGSLEIAHGATYSNQ
ncbi:PiggyBac transposable element-derived protein 3 [Trichinella sp. T8]|nr:PiggyBac transposable element-derived protein 3 [Trichinella sp. T8]